VIAAVLAGMLVLAIACGLVWTARQLHIGALDASELVAKLATPRPDSALDWPELRVRAALAADITGESDLALLHVEWPEHPEHLATLLVDLGAEHDRSLTVLSQWCSQNASISPSRCGPKTLELRRRQSLERVRGQLVKEDYGATAPPGAQVTRRTDVSGG
jgi:hypothetical protein